MTKSHTCANCGAAIPPDAPEGICPACALGRGLGLGSGRAEADLAADEAAFRRSQMDALSSAFPQYELLEMLGRGGMGEVYKARQKKLNRIVAIKILPEPFGKLDEFTERFHREAQSLARLNHPNIVTIYDYGEAEGLCYFVMEYIDGVDLKRTIDAGSLTADEALQIVPQVCDALQFAHDCGIVHRDIKPANILITRTGLVKIADFGIAKIVGKAPTDITLTAMGDVMGTPEYMAPEQRRATQSVDHRADIYSLGVVFYEMLTGEVPMGHFAPPSQKVQIDVRLDDIVLRTLEREPERRYQKASEVKTGVETVTSTAIRRAPADPVRHIQRFPVGLIALWALLFALLWFALGPLWNLRAWGVVAGGVVIAAVVGAALFVHRRRFPIIAEQWQVGGFFRRTVRVFLLVTQCILFNALMLSGNLALKERIYWPSSYNDPDRFEEYFEGAEYKLLRQLEAYSEEVPPAELVADGFFFSGGVAFLSKSRPSSRYFSKHSAVLLYIGAVLLFFSGVNVIVSTDLIRLRVDPAWRRTIRPIAVFTLAVAGSLVLKFFASIFTLPFHGTAIKNTAESVPLPLEEVAEPVRRKLAEEGLRLGDSRSWTLHSVPGGKPLAKARITSAWRLSPFDRWTWSGWRLVQSSPQVSVLYISGLDPVETKATFSMKIPQKEAIPQEELNVIYRLRDLVKSLNP